MFERLIAGKDIATGKVVPTVNYKTKGPATSNFREGNSTVQFKVLPPNATYNTTTNKPNPTGKKATRHMRLEARRQASLLHEVY